MLQSFFFIPANNDRFIGKVKSIHSDYFIFDLEDSISISETESSLYRLSTTPIHNNHFVRPRLFFDNDNSLDLTMFVELLRIGFTNFILPKLSSAHELERIKNVLDLHSASTKSETSFILLVENPLCLLNLADIIQLKIINIIGIALGSHDYSDAIGMRHTWDNLQYPRFIVLNTAKAFGVKAIDSASMNVNDSRFDEECYNAYHMGYDGKFLVHPNQLQTLNEVEYYSKDEIADAQLVYKKLMNQDRNNFSLIKINNIIYEKAHIQRIINIVKWANSLGYEMDGGKT